MSDETNFIGNISTIVKYVSMLIAGWFIGLLVSHGLNLPITTEGLSECISTIIFLILAHIDATNPNSIWNQKSSNENPGETDPLTENEDDENDI